MNHLKGKNLSVVGLPNLEETVYFLYGMRAGTEIKKSQYVPTKNRIQKQVFLSEHIQK